MDRRGRCDRSVLDATLSSLVGRVVMMIQGFCIQSWSDIYIYTYRLTVRPGDANIGPVSLKNKSVEVSEEVNYNEGQGRIKRPQVQQGSELKTGETISEFSEWEVFAKTR